MYTVTIDSAGTVQFQPRFVRDRKTVLGEVKKGHINDEQLRELLAAFEKVDYFSFKDSYEAYSKDCPQSWTDHPSAITSITLNGKSKSVNHYYGCKGNDSLKKLTELESKIDEIANTKAWLVSEDQQFELFWAAFKRAVLKNDKQKVASMARFPLEGDMNVRSRSQFLKQYNNIFPIGVRRMVAEAKPYEMAGRSYILHYEMSVYLLFEKDGTVYKLTQLGAYQ